jgi:hypothetical protein
MDDDDEKWHKSELTLRVGIYELAQAVVTQWIHDGRPCNCDIDVWLNILRLGKQEKDYKSNEHTVAQ